MAKMKYWNGTTWEVLDAKNADTVDGKRADAAATANTVIVRDANGRAKVAAPSASDDIARKAEVDTKVSKSGDTMTGKLTIAPAGNASIEMGRVDGVASYPFIDFHSGATAVDYDSRIIASGGTGVVGGGTLDIKAANVITNGYKIWHAGNDGAGSGLDADKLQGKVPSDFMSATKVYGSVTYTDSIAANSTLTKSIALGGSYKHGMAVVSENAVNVKLSGLVFFGTNNLKTKAVGYYSGSAACREHLGSVTTTYGFGLAWTGNNKIRINELYISGTNLVIVFNNRDTTNSNALNCRIDWEVW